MIKQYKSIPDSSYWTKAEYCENIHELVEKNKVDKPLYGLLLKLIPKKVKVLEGGAGNGWIVAAMLEKGIDWTGIEYSCPLVKEFKRQYPKYSASMYFGDAKKLQFDDNIFDIYFSPGVIEHYEETPDDINRILEEAKRVVKPNGKILISVPVMNLPRWIGLPLSRMRERKTRHLPFYQFIYTRKEIQNRLKKSGLKIKRAYRTGIHGVEFFGIRLFPKFLWNNKLLNRLFSHMLLFECINKKD